MQARVEVFQFSWEKAFTVTVRTGSKHCLSSFLMMSFSIYHGILEFMKGERVEGMPLTIGEDLKCHGSKRVLIVLSNG